MLKFLGPRVARRVPRTSIQDIRVDGGRSRIVFNDVVETTSSLAAKSRFLVVNCLPPAPTAPSDINSPNSSLCPPYHIHLKEDETFRVVEGQAKFLLLDQNRRQDPSREERRRDGITQYIVRPDETITIRRGQIHTFRNASSDHGLVLEFGFSPPGLETATEPLNSKMKRFFLNTQLYRSDCTSQGIPRSMSQVLLFNHHADVALVPNWLLLWHRRWPKLRGFLERVFAPSLGRIMNLFGGVVLGRWLFGLRSTYEEYCQTAETERTVIDHSESVSKKDQAIESKLVKNDTQSDMFKQRKGQDNAQD